MWGPTRNLGPIGSAVLTFVGYKQTQTPKLNLYIHVQLKIALAYLQKETLVSDQI